MSLDGGSASGPPVRNSTLIAGLVSQLRAGKITNAQLWEQLQSITSGGGAAAAKAGGSTGAAASAAPAPASSVNAPPVAAVPPPVAPPAASAGPAPPAVPARGTDSGDGDAGAASTGVANMAQEQRRELVQRLLQEKLQKKRQQQAAEREAAEDQTRRESQGSDDGDHHGDHHDGDAGGVGEDVPHDRRSDSGGAQDHGHRHTLSLDDFMAHNPQGAAGLAAYDAAISSPTGAVNNGGLQSGRRQSPVADRRHDSSAAGYDDRYDGSGGDSVGTDGGDEAQPYTQESYMRPSQQQDQQQQQRHSSGGGYRDSTPRRGPGPARRSMSAQRHRPARGAQPDQNYSFQPEIRPLPASYGGATRHMVDGPFEERVARWKQQREEATRLKRKEREESKTAGCTFQPKINHNSRLTAERSRGVAAVPVTERLYNHAKKLQQKRGITPKRLARRRSLGGSSADSRGPVPSRFEPEPERPLTLKEQEELETECTFRPKINKTHQATPVRSRYRSQTPSRARRSVPTGMDECTFTPHVNPVKPEMGLAQMYVQTEVFDRLSRPRAVDKARAAEAAATANAANTNGFVGGRGNGAAAHDSAAANAPDRPVMDMNAFLTAMGRGDAAGAGAGGGYSGSTASGGFGGTGAQQQQQQQRGRSQSATRRRPGGKKVNFGSFLDRMRQKEAERKRKLEEARKPQYTHKPKLSEGSKKLIAERGRTGGFLKRVEKNALRKEYDVQRRKERERLDGQCTFKPRINATSAKRKPRSFVEMSRGDALKRETAQRLLRLKAEQDELAGLTFRPKTNVSGRHGKEVSGRLNVLSDPESYLKRVAAEAQALEDKQRRAVQEAQMREFEQCTFKPQIHEAPAYIKRIARSMALTKAARPPEPNAKPDWK